MTGESPFLRMVRDIIEANAWGKELTAEESPPPGPPGWSPGQSIVRIRAAESADPPDPAEVVGIYAEGQTYPEQIQSDCLRFLLARNIRNNIQNA